MSKIYLQGGFGNVLFQLVHYLSLRNNGHNPVFVDTLTKKNLMTRLLGWKIHDKIYLDVFQDLGVTVQVQSFLKTAAIMILGKLSQRLNTPVLSTYFFSDLYKDRYLTQSNHVFGYFQSKRYLKSKQKEILQIAKVLQNRYMFQDLEPYLAVHYRYGDSVWAREYEAYYTAVKQNIQPNNNVIILTDSKERAEEFFKDLEVSSLQIMSNTPLEDFSYLVSAKELYCALSTFSWWAAQCVSSTKSVYLPHFLENKLGFYGDTELKLK
jgi:hypothetical protein